MALHGRAFPTILLFVPLVLGQAEDKITPVVGSVNGSVTLNCDLPVTDPPRLKWKDDAYSMDRTPATIFCSNMGLHENHYNYEAYEISADNPTQLVITGLKDTDVGSYFCISTQEDGSELTHTFKLALAGDIECSSDSETNEFSEGDKIDAMCKVPFSATVSPQFKWFIGDDVIAGVDKSIFGTLWIENSLDATREMDQQELICRLSFHGFLLECPIPLSVKHAPYVKQFEDSVGQDMKKHSFSCAVSANPAPTVHILKLNDDNSTRPLDAKRAKVSRDGATATVTFGKLKRMDAGRYVCKASNAIGQGSSVATLTVSAEPSTPKPGKKPGRDEKLPSTGDGGSAESQFVLVTSLVILGFSMVLHVL